MNQTQDMAELIVCLRQRTGLTQEQLAARLRVTCYAPTQPNTRWHELSDRAKKALQQWIGAANYADFQRLVDLTLNRFEPRDRYADSDKGKGRRRDKTAKQFDQLRSRREFWSNYSDRFTRIRIFLPQSSASILRTRLKRLPVE